MTTLAVFVAALGTGALLGWLGVRAWYAVRIFRRLLAEHHAWLLRLEWEDHRLISDVDEVDRLVEEWAK